MTEDYAVTVLYYDDDDPLILKNTVFRNLPISERKRVILPDSFRPHRTIIAVMEGEVKILSRLGDRAQYLSSNSSPSSMLF